MKPGSILAALACLFAIAGLTAQAGLAETGTTITGKIDDVVFGPPTAECPGALFQADFALVSPRGDALGDGTSCVQGWAGQPCPFPTVSGCHQTTLATFTFNLDLGSITAPMTIAETFVEGGVVEHGEGDIVDASGTFAGAQGSVEYSGILRFAGEADLTFLVQMD
jgi:hypothetical protein